MSESASRHRPLLVVINDDTPYLELMEALLEGRRDTRSW